MSSARFTRGCILAVTAIVLTCGTAAGAFAPTDIPDCKLWLRADAGVQTSGSTVTNWLDQSGNNNHATASGDPQLTPDGGVNFDNRPVVTFD